MPRPILTESDIKRIISVNVRRLRNAKGWSQEMLGHFADLHPTEISRLERQLRTPRITTVHKVATALGVTMDDLLTDHAQQTNDGRPLAEVA